MEEKLGRQIAENESVRFAKPSIKRMLAETGTCSVGDLVLIKKRTTSLRARKARIEARIAELQSELNDINRELRED
jgi:hypothetical protein